MEARAEKKFEWGNTTQEIVQYLILPRDETNIARVTKYAEIIHSIWPKKATIDDKEEAHELLERALNALDEQSSAVEAKSEVEAKSIRPTKEQINHLLEMAFEKNKKLTPQHFTQMLLWIGEKETFNKSKDPAPGDSIDLAYNQIFKNKAAAVQIKESIDQFPQALADLIAGYSAVSDFSQLMFFNRKDRIQYVWNNPDEICIGMNTGKKNEDVVARFNPVITVAPGKKERDLHRLLMDLGDNNKPCLVYTKDNKRIRCQNIFFIFDMHTELREWLKKHALRSEISLEKRWNTPK